MFFARVAPFEITQKSPKHPQSDTGFATAIYNVSGSITAIMAAATQTAVRLNEPVAMRTPVQNSTHARATQAVSTASRGTVSPHTVRYSFTLMRKPHGSIDFAHPEMMKVKPTIMRDIHTKVRRSRSLATVCILSELDNAEYGVVDHIEIIGIDAFRYFCHAFVVLDLFRTLNFRKNEIDV